MRFGKNILSQYLRSNCELALYLSLFEPEEAKAKGLPAPLEARSSTDSLKRAGIEQESFIYRLVERGFGSTCIRGEWKQEELRDTPIAEALSTVHDAPAILLQPRLDLSTRQKVVFARFGVSKADQDVLPELRAFIPDIVLVEAARPGDCELQPDGARLSLDDSDTRLALTVIDVKHAREANPSYEAEVVLYALMLSNWLDLNGFSDRFFVRADGFLWTRKGLENDGLRTAVEAGERDPHKLIEAIRTDLSPVNLPIYIQAVRRLFSETLPAVIKKGEDDVEALEWHVSASCGSCDWLGYKDWISAKDLKEIGEEGLKRYCYNRAASCDHLSRVPLVTKGSRRTLENAGITTVAELAQIDGDHSVFMQHSRLQADRRSIPGYAEALTAARVGNDDVRKDGSLASYADLNVFISVNFDPGSGLITGVGLRADFRPHTPFGQAKIETDNPRWVEAWITAKKSHEAERVTVLAMLEKLAEILAFVEDTSPGKGGPHAKETSVQFLFWTGHQFEELCLALGRHLHHVLFERKQPKRTSPDYRRDRLLRALFWLFPSEEIQRKADIDPPHPAIAFVCDVARRLVRIPAEHALTLMNVYEHYRYGMEDGKRPYMPDRFYWDPLSDGIPRERIYEIWHCNTSESASITRAGKEVSVVQLLSSFHDAITQQLKALSSITYQLRKDFKPKLTATASGVSLTVPSWTNSVATDSKLWLAWAKFENQYSSACNYATFLQDPDEIESSNQGLRLERRLDVLPNGDMVFQCSPGSSNSKIRAVDEYLCMAPDTIPGCLAQNRRVHLADGDIDPDAAFLNPRLYRLTGCTLISFDRVRNIAVVRWNKFYGETREEMQSLRDSLLTKFADEFSESVTLLSSLGSDATVKRAERILCEVGNPPNAKPSENALAALGLQAAPKTKGTSAITPVSRVLWEADSLANEAVPATFECADIERVSMVHALNKSQIGALEAADTRRLTLIWGPPGTGKTKTCAALLQALVERRSVSARGAPYAILVTGPTYKAVMELANRLISALSDAGQNVPCYYLRSSTRADDFKPVKVPNSSVETIELEADHEDDRFVGMMKRLTEGSDLVIVATVMHQCGRLTEQWARVTKVISPILPLFDFVLIDESSQVDMANATGPLALLKPDFQLIVAGDHLQMPPVFQTEPPLGAEYLVGSLQTYLIKRFEVRPQTLLINYRSHTDIVAYTKRLGYPAELQAAYPDTALHWINDPRASSETLDTNSFAASKAWASCLDSKQPIVAVTHRDGLSGQANPFEASCVTAIARIQFDAGSQHLDNRGQSLEHTPWSPDEFWKRGIGVVTPHRAQRAEVVKALSRAFPDHDPLLIEDAVDTVERFQGGERHLVLISFGVGDPDVIDGEERFLLQLERANVAISRAMAKCILIMSEEMAEHIPSDRKAAADAHALRGIIDEWCARRQIFTVHLPDGSSREIIVRTRSNHLPA
jgi:hypothetical protein